MSQRVWAVAVLLALGLATLGGARAADFELQEARAQLAPTGKLRAAFMMANPALVTSKPGSEQMDGLAGDLARAIAEQIGVPLQPRIYSAVKTFQSSLGSGEWDIALVTRVPYYANFVDFSANFALIDQVFLVSPGKKLKEIAEVDHEGVRIIETADSDAENIHFAIIKNAQLLRVTTDSEQAIRLMKSGAGEVYGDNAEFLTGIAVLLPGTRFLPGRFAVVPAAIAVARGRPAALAFVNQFLQQAKASGLIQRSIERAHLHGVSVPPS